MSDPATTDKTDREKWLLSLLVITAADIEAAKQLWIDHAPRAFRGLPLGEGFTYDPQTLIYTANSGKEVSDRDVKRLSILLALAIGHELQKQSAYVTEATVTEWRDQAAATIKDLFIVQAALGAGGFHRLTSEAIAVLIGSIEAQTGLAFSLDRLWAFGEAIENHEPRADSLEAIGSRAFLYGETSNAVYEAVRREEAINARDDKGRPLYLFERNILGDPSSTHCSECPELTARGWAPIGTMPAIGSRQCKMRCYCSMEYSLTGPAAENDL